MKRLKLQLRWHGTRGIIYMLGALTLLLGVCSLDSLVSAHSITMAASCKRTKNNRQAVRMARVRNSQTRLKNKIVFSRSGHTHLMNVDGSKQTRLINKSPSDSPAILSPDGKSLLFTRYAPPKNTESYISARDLGRDSTANLYTRPTWRGKAKRLTLGFQVKEFKFSPDGKQIAFTNTAHDVNQFSSQIHIMNVDGSGLKQVTRNERDEDILFTPNGQQIIFRSGASYIDEPAYNRKLHIINTNGTGQMLFNVVGEELPAFSPDGQMMAFVRYGRLYVANPDGTQERGIYKPPLQQPHYFRGTPLFSPDGRRIIFLINHYNNLEPHKKLDSRDNLEVHIINTDGSNHLHLTNNPKDDFAPCFSPDSKKIGWVSNRSGNNEIYTMNTDGSGQRRLTNNKADDNNPSWR